MPAKTSRTTPPGQRHLQLRQEASTPPPTWSPTSSWAVSRQHQQQNYAPVDGEKFHQWSIYGQDSWKAARSLTINIGFRLDHMGNWYGYSPSPYPGIQVFDLTNFVNSNTAPSEYRHYCGTPQIPASRHLDSRRGSSTSRLESDLPMTLRQREDCLPRRLWDLLLSDSGQRRPERGKRPTRCVQLRNAPGNGFAGYNGHQRNFTPPSSVEQNGHLPPTSPADQPWK